MSNLRSCEVVQLPVSSRLQEGSEFHSKIKNCELIYLPKIEDPRGNLTFIEGKRHMPFPIKRVFYLYDVPGGSERGGHAHRNLYQFLIAMSGSFDIYLDDGFKREVIHLNRSNYGLLIGPMVWREMANFSSNSICMVLASDYYDEDEYFRDYSEFMTTVHGGVKQ